MAMRMLMIITLPLFVISHWFVFASGKGIYLIKQNEEPKTKETIQIPFNNLYICKISGRRATCQGRGQSLKEIPSLPGNVTNITVTGFTVTNLTESFFSQVTHLDIESLDLSENSIQHISKGAFINLNTLRKLDLSYNNFATQTLRDALPVLSGPNISVLILNGMNWTELAPDLFQGLTMTNITKLSLSRNLFSELNGSVFSHLKSLKTLTLSENVLYYLELVGMDNLAIFDLRENDISRPYIFCKNYSKFSSHIEVLNLKGNHLRFITQETFRCMKQLKTLILDNNPITTLVNNMLRDMSSITELHVSRLCQINRIENTAFKSKSLKHLYFRDNSFQFHDNSDLMKIFQHFPQLETLDISNNYLNPPLNLSKIFSNLISLQTLNLGKTRLYVMPENVFMHMKNLSRLYLNSNRIASWDGPKVFGRSKSIKRLRLLGNYVTVVNQTSFPESLLVSLEELDMSDNHFSCTCENLWFRSWIRDNQKKPKYKVKLVNYKNYTCKSPKKMSDAGVRFIDYNPTKVSCTEEPVWMYAIVAVAALIVITVTIASVLYKCRWNIRYKIYLMRRYKYTRIPNEEEFVYASYVIYSDNDREWVHDVFRKRLEDTEGIRLCVRLRDFEAGKSIVDNIAENMHLSRKIVIVISNNFAKDEWCRFELFLAHHRCVTNEDGLVFVMLNEVNSDNLTESLHVLITSNSYALWSEEETGETLFWEQVIEQLK